MKDYTLAIGKQEFSYVHMRTEQPAHQNYLFDVHTSQASVIL